MITLYSKKDNCHRNELIITAVSCMLIFFIYMTQYDADTFLKMRTAISVCLTIIGIIKYYDSISVSLLCFGLATLSLYGEYSDVDTLSLKMCCILTGLFVVAIRTFMVSKKRPENNKYDTFIKLKPIQLDAMYNLILFVLILSVIIGNLKGLNYFNNNIVVTGAITVVVLEEMVFITMMLNLKSAQTLRFLCYMIECFVYVSMFTSDTSNTVTIYQAIEKLIILVCIEYSVYKEGLKYAQ